ncbi:MAG: hypothetical protein KJZ80_14320 [Hyphomicrobiaceae bacterium]|nr:hypothetical protein [Hyphomicrobiaceae bacterium]
MTTTTAEGAAGGAGALITLDAPTIWAAAATILFTVGGGMALGMLPEAGPLVSAIDALKNLTYVLAIPVFDISRRLLARRQMQRTDALPVGSSRNVFFVVFVSALILFVVTEIVSFLLGYGLGYMCSTIAQTAAEIRSGDCFRFGAETLGAVLILPIMLAIGIACGWIWFRLLRGRFWSALMICAVLLAILFSIDLVLALRNAQHELVAAMVEQIRSLGIVVQVGKQVVILVVAVLIGYGLARFWSGVARWIG